VQSLNREAVKGMGGLQMSRREHGLGLKRGTVALKAHQAEWEREAARTIKRFDGYFRTGGQRISSMSAAQQSRTIPAKPILDIAVAAPDLAAAEACRPALEKAGYRQSSSTVGDELLFVAGDFAADTRSAAQFTS